MCQNCNTLYFNCEANGCYLAWRTVKELCAMKHIEGPQGFDVTSIMALPLKIKSPDGSPRPGATRLLLIAASECVFLLWKLRCRRLFDDNDEIRNRHTDPQEVSDPSPIKSSSMSLVIALTLLPQCHGAHLFWHATIAPRLLYLVRTRILLDRE